MLELTHLKVDGPCQIVVAPGQTQPLICVVGQPVPTAALPPPSAAAARSARVATFGAGARFAGEMLLTALGVGGALLLALWLMLLWPLIAECGRLLGVCVFYTTGFSGRAVSNRLLHAGASLHARSHVLHAGAALYSRLRLPRTTARQRRAERHAVLTAKVED